jgi:hypothetical protein
VKLAKQVILQPLSVGVCGVVFAQKQVSKTLMMKRFVLIVIVLFSWHSAFSQQAERDHISEAIKAGNAKMLASHFMSSVDLTVVKVEEVYSKEQAEMIVSRFFVDNPPKGFSIRHEGKSKLDDHFYIGDLQTSNAAYRVTFFLKKEGNEFKVRQLRIEAD